MKLLLYCTKAKPYLYKTEDTTYPAYPIGYHTDKDLKLKLSNTNELANLNGKIVAECDFDVETYLTEKSWFSQKVRVVNKRVCDGVAKYSETEDMINSILDKSCLTIEELTNYMNFKDNIINQKELYAINIKDLKIFDKPRELYDCLIHPKIEPKYYGCEHLSKAPQNMMYVELDDIRYILISIRPEWLCKILNGEKTIEVRKKVLKEMIN